MNNKNIIFRLDDIGASSKQFEIYSRNAIGNLLFFKRLKYFAAWGPYPEITPTIWKKIIEILAKQEAKMTIAITASWVDEKNSLIPFPDMFPKQAEIIRNGVKDGFVEVANHGLTHCVVGKHLPKIFSSNRNFHREFWSYIAKEIHYQHLKKSQEILQSYFGRIVTFVPPGYVWTNDTEAAATKFGIKYLCGKANQVVTGKKSNQITYISDSESFPIHDRDIVINGMKWLQKQITNLKNKNNKLITVRNFVIKLKK